MKPNDSRDDASVLRERLKANTSYHTLYDYNSSTNCEASGCDQEGICRCSVIEDFHITHADPKAIIGLLEELYPGDIEKYCLDRIIQHGPAGTTEAYERTNSGGYYGEEVGDITLTEGNVTKVIEDLTKFSALPSDVEKVKFALMKEYSYILPELANLKKVYVEAVPLDKLQRTMRKLDGKAQEQYKKELRTYDFKQHAEKFKLPNLKPRGFALKEQSGWRLIDGYHRVGVVAQFTKEPTVMLVVGE